MSFAKLDAKWLNQWKKLTPVLPRRSDAPKFYQLCMFPYPSGRLHVGHLRVFAISDSLARFKRMRGFNVVHPMGWDAFGLPAENAAIQNGIDAEKWTLDHIKAMREQAKGMLTSFDWDREVITCSPGYYKHTQQIFLWLLEHNLVYRKRAMVNWDPIDKTVLANEQIDSEGRSWRSGALAEPKMLEQWFVKITEYAEQLVSDLKSLEMWPNKVKSMQSNWIRLSKGMELDFGEIKVFTTRPDTLDLVEFIAVNENHPILEKRGLKESLDSENQINDLYVTNPLNGEKLPVFVADYVVDYGTKAVMGVPTVDERDLKFWESKSLSKHKVKNDSASTKGLIDPGKLKNIGKPVANMHLHDWLISRQRFWGAPIPIIHCSSCGEVPVPSEQLPVLLPEPVTDAEGENSTSIPLSQRPEWINTTCPKCHGPAKRDTDTMDTFMDSSWYFLRYLDPHNETLPFNKEVGKTGMPVDCYVGGVEHAILHLLYSRFLYKFFIDAKRLDLAEADFKEPFKRLITLGMVHGKTYVDEKGKYLTPAQAEAYPDPEKLTISMEKMSKSKLNGVDPLEVIEKHGADAVRAHMLFQAPVDKTCDWDDKKIVGIERWMRRVQSAVDSVAENAKASSADDLLEVTIPETDANKQIVRIVTGVTNTLESSLNLNTVISDYMKLTNLMYEIQDPETKLLACKVLIRIMAPVLPAFADEMNARLVPVNDEYKSVHTQSWPVLSLQQLKDDEQRYRLIIGKTTKQVKAGKDFTDEMFIDLAGLPADTKIKNVVIKHDKRLCVINI